MRRQLILLPLLAASLPACSLINSYDDVVTTQGSGGGTTSSTTTGSGGTGSGTGGSTTTTTGSGGGGSPPTLDCTVSDNFTVEDLSTEVAPNRWYDDKSLGYQPNGDQLNVFLRRAGVLRGLQINLSSHTIGNTYETPMWDASPGRQIGSGQYGMLVSRPPVNGLYPMDFIVFGNNFTNPSVYAISDGSLTPTAIQTPRTVWAHRGPAAEDIDIVARVDEANNGLRTFYHRHDAGAVTTTATEIVPPAPFADSEEASPRGVIRTGDGKVHAFVGNPTMAGTGGTRQWTFLDTAATATSPAALGGGYILLDAFRKSATENLITYGHITTSLALEGAQVGDNKVSTISEADLSPMITLGSFLDFPSGGEMKIQDEALVLAGPSQTKDQMILIIGRIGGTGMALYEPELFQPEAGAKLGEVAVFVTNAPISSLGGIAYIVYTERHDPGPNQYDLVKVAQLACQKQ